MNVLDLIVDSLLSWVAAKGILKSVINPKDLVRAWVKVYCKNDLSIIFFLQIEIVILIKEKNTSNLYFIQYPLP